MIGILLALSAGPPLPFPPGAFQAGSGLVAVAYVSGGRVVAASLNSGLLAFDARSGRRLDPLGPISWPDLAPHPSGDAVLVSGNGGTGILDLKSGTHRWGVGALESSAVWGPAGKWVAALNTAGGIVIRLPGDGRYLHALHDGPHRSVAISAHPTRHEVAAVRADGSLAVFDPFTGEVAWRAVAHTPRVWPATPPCISHAGDVLATGGTDGVVRVWGKGGRPGRVLAMRPAACRALAGTAGRVAAAFTDGRVRIIDTRDGKTLAEWAGTPSRLSFSPDGRELAGVSPGSSRLTLWDGRSGVLMSPRRAEADLAALRVLPGGVLGVAAKGPTTSPEVISADGRLSAVTDMAGLIIRERGTGSRLAYIKAGPTAAFTLSRDGRLIAAVLGTGDVLAWEVSTGKQVYHLKQAAAGRGPPSLLFAHDGRRLAHVRGDGRVFVSDLAAGTAAEAFALTGDPRRRFGPRPLAWSPDGRLAGADETRAFVWHPGSRLTREWTHGGMMAPSGLAFSADGRLLAAGNPPRVWEVASGSLVWGDGLRGRGGLIAFAPDGRLLEAHHPGCAVLWDPVAARPRPATLADCWERLAGPDAGDALAAARSLAVTPSAAAYLGKMLKAPEGLSAVRIARLLMDLDSDDFETRTGAEKELHEGAWSAAEAIRKALEAGPGLEVRARLRRILANWDRSPESLRLTRAVLALELMRTGEARAVLRRLAAGPDSAPVTGEARAALARLGR